MERYVKITESEMDAFLKPEKGWVKQISGYEYVYDYKHPCQPFVVKVMSSISIKDATGRNKGSDAIRVFAVRVDRNNRVVGGLVRSKRVYRTMNWKENLQTLVIETIQAAKKIIPT